MVKVGYARLGSAVNDGRNQHLRWKLPGAQDVHYDSPESMLERNQAAKIKIALDRKARRAAKNRARNAKLRQKIDFVKTKDDEVITEKEKKSFKLGIRTTSEE